MALYYNDGYSKLTFRPSSTSQEEDTTRIKVRTYRSEFPEIYADPRRIVVEFIPISEEWRTHGVALEISGSVGELESLFSRAIAAMHETVNSAGDSGEYQETEFKSPAEMKRLQEQVKDG